MAYKDKNENVSAKIDWLKIRFRHPPKEVIEQLLKFKISDFELREGSLHYYSHDCLLAFGLIHIYCFNENIPDTILQLSGKACSQFEEVLKQNNLTWRDFFKDVRELQHDILRIDVALDDRNVQPYFHIDQLIRKCKKNQYYSHGRDYTIFESKYRLTTGKTLNIGSRTSDLMFRIYDKAIEQAKQTGVDVSEYGTWNRVELEVKKEPANDLVNIIINSNLSLENIARAVIKQELKFFTNEERTKICRWWEKFLTTTPPIKLQRKKEITSLKQTLNWLVEGGGGLAIYQAFKFLEVHRALGDLDLSEFNSKQLFSRQLADKMVNHLILIGRKDLIKLVHERTKIEEKKGEK